MSDNTNVEYLKLLFEEWRYRHQNYWGFVYLWFIAIAAILAAPLITPAFHDDAGGLVAVFSAIALFFASQKTIFYTS